MSIISKSVYWVQFLYIGHMGTYFFLINFLSPWRVSVLISTVTTGIDMTGTSDCNWTLFWVKNLINMKMSKISKSGLLVILIPVFLIWGLFY